MAGLLSTIRTLSSERLGLPPPAPVRSLPKAVRELGDLGIEERNDLESWDDFIIRINPAEPSELGLKDLKRLASELWSYPELERFGPSLLEHCGTRSKRVLDKCLARSYWNRFNPELPIFADLARYCATRSDRLPSRWRQMAEEFPLWDHELGPKALGQLLLEPTRRETMLSRVNLDMRDMQGGFVEEAFSALLRDLSKRSTTHCSEFELLDEAAIILELAESLGAGVLRSNAGLISYVLLKPWINRAANAEHKDALRVFLVKQFGDPRTKQNEWLSRAKLLHAADQVHDAPEVFQLLNRWLTERSVELFFEIIADTTERKDHWMARRAFWNAYLETGAISDAWCILGSQAERQVRMLTGVSSSDFGRVEGNAIDPGHSALLMKIGDLVIADWSHVGAVRFWKLPNCPSLYSRKYFGKNLDRSAGYGYARTDYIPVKSMSHIGKWYRKFSDFIRKETGVVYSGPKGADLWGW